MNGSINVSVTGGVTPYTFIWSNGETTEDIADLLKGNYCVTVSDGAACVSTACVTVSEVEGINLVFDIQDVGARFYTYIYTSSTLS